jgi:hypothetical protein
LNKCEKKLKEMEIRVNFDRESSSTNKKSSLYPNSSLYQHDDGDGEQYQRGGKKTARTAAIGAA